MNPVSLLIRMQSVVLVVCFLLGVCTGLSSVYTMNKTAKTNDEKKALLEELKKFPAYKTT